MLTDGERESIQQCKAAIERVFGDCSQRIKDDRLPEREAFLVADIHAQCATLIADIDGLMFLVDAASGNLQ